LTDLGQIVPKQNLNKTNRHSQAAIEDYPLPFLMFPDWYSNCLNLFECRLEFLSTRFQLLQSEQDGTETPFMGLCAAEYPVYDAGSESQHHIEHQLQFREYADLCGQHYLVRWRLGTSRQLFRE